MATWRHVIATSVSVLVTVVLAAVAHAALHVMPPPAGNDANSGLDWSHPKATISGAMAAASAGTEIWVAAGTYQEHVQMKSGVGLYGGFSGSETARDQRNWTTNTTTIDGTDSGTVVSMTGAGETTRLDGFTITQGNANPTDPTDPGGGISLVTSAAIITNNVITGNHSHGSGGGVKVSGYRVDLNMHPVISANRIVDNSAAEGGAIAIVNASPAVTENTIEGNVAGGNGGAIACWQECSPVITHNVIRANAATASDIDFDDNDGGGSIYATSRQEDGWPCNGCTSRPTIANNVIAANAGFPGGGISIVDSNGGIALIANNTVMANSGSGIHWKETLPLVSNTPPVIVNNIVAFNTWGLNQEGIGSIPAAVVSNCVYGNSLFDENTNYQGIADKTGTAGNISAHPLMVDHRIGRFHVQPASPCVDAGFPAAVQPGWKDIDGQSRIIGASVDIGADESDGTQWSTVVPVVRVRTDGSDTQDGASWEKAKKTLGAAIKAAAKTGGEVWAAGGTYSEHIVIPAFVHLYGGFAGNETTREARNVTVNVSIIDGGGTPPVVESRNGGYLVSALDGFVVQNGGIYTGGETIEGTQGFPGIGAGIRISVSSPLIRNNTIAMNSLGNPHTYLYGGSKGAGIGIFSGYPIISRNTLIDNENLCDAGMGGAVYCGRSMPTIEENVIYRNHAREGSAVYCTGSTPLIRGNTIDTNSQYSNFLYSGSGKGAVTLTLGANFLIERNRIARNTAAQGGGIHVSDNKAGTVVNNLITDNLAYDPTSFGGTGGGILCLANIDATGSLFIVNNTIVNNTGSAPFGEQGGGISVWIPSPIFTPPEPIPDRVVIANNVIAFNSSGIWLYPSFPLVPPTLLSNDLFNTYENYSANLSPGATDISADPGFVDREGDDLHLNPTSPCVDRAANSVLTSAVTRDFDLKPRIMDSDENGSATVDMGAYEACGAIFSDAGSDFWARHYIRSLYCGSITTGCTQTPLNYCPGNNVTRQAMAAFIIRAMEGEPPLNYCDGGSPFTDVPPDNQFCRYIKRMKELNITLGCNPPDNDRYCPTQTVKRQAMAAFIIRTVYGESFSFTSTPHFIDVPEGHQFFKYVQKMKDEGITTGCSTTDYCPANTVTRASMAAFLARAFLGMP